MNVGERIGDYEIVSVLGAGGMGEVYKVRNTLSDRIEAMKILLPNLESNAELAERFLREIKVQAALDHPNIAKLHTALRADNRLLMIMEFVEGESLEAMAARSAIGVQDAMRYAEQVLSALAYAHGRGVIHRDIKPTNIMVTKAGVAKLMDFGIAKLKTDQRLTQTGRTIGSLFYMSPEQIRGSEPDPRSDLYALGVTLYELVTRRRPFSGDSDFSIMSAHLQATPPPPVEIVPGVPELLSDVIVMAMAKDPQARFQTAEAMRTALLRAMGQPPAAAPHAAATPPALPQTGPPALPTQPMPAAQAAAPLSASVPAPPSRRGLYMTLGSLVTIAVIAAAVIEGPRYLRARAGEQATPAQVSTPAEPAPQTKPAPASEPPAPQNPSQDSSAAPQSKPIVTPAPAPVPAPVPSRHESNPRPIAPRQAAAPAPRAQQTVVSQPVQPVPEPVQQQPAPRPVVNPAQASPPGAELNELREKHNDLAIRAASAGEGLQSIRQQMAAQGLGLRADIREAETRMNVQMRQAMDSIVSGDVNGAREHLRYAQNAIETIEKFLGH